MRGLIDASGDVAASGDGAAIIITATIEGKEERKEERQTTLANRATPAGAEIRISQISGAEKWWWSGTWRQFPCFFLCVSFFFRVN